MASLKSLSASPRTSMRECSAVIHEGKLTDPFRVTTVVRQGCLLSPFLFLLAVNWIMRNSTDRDARRDPLGGNLPNLMTWTMQMTSAYCHIVKNKCRTKAPT